ncbi:MAG: alpha/beta hydrolase [Coriobacteriia bacterium]|nr:alpha/beta hydrolase [Coriobacteriia bacterium]
MDWAYNKKLKVDLGGLPQKIHIWSKDTTKPILLVLHGGPGIPNRGALRKADLDLCDSFTLVGWDQRGTGGSYAGSNVENLTIDRMIDDTAELIGWLTKRFQQEKAFILGLSWGTGLGTLLALRYPELVAAYVGSGQLVNMIENEDRSYAYTLACAQEAHDDKSLAILKRIGPPAKGIYTPVVDGLIAQRKILSKYGGHLINHGKSYVGSMVSSILLSPEYGLRDTWGILKGYRLTLEKVWPVIAEHDFARGDTELRFTMPYHIFQGVRDENTPSSLVQDYFDRIEAPRKELVWFENSAHGPLVEEPQRFKRLLCEILLT